MRAGQVWYAAAPHGGARVQAAIKMPPAGEPRNTRPEQLNFLLLHDCTSISTQPKSSDWWSRLVSLPGHLLAFALLYESVACFGKRRPLRFARAGFPASRNAAPAHKAFRTPACVRVGSNLCMTTSGSGRAA